MKPWTKILLLTILIILLTTLFVLFIASQEKNVSLEHHPINNRVNMMHTPGTGEPTPGARPQ